MAHTSRKAGGWDSPEEELKINHDKHVMGSPAQGRSGHHAKPQVQGDPQLPL